MMDTKSRMSERERKVAEIAEHSARINNRERERRVRYLISALSPEHVPHRA
ncbi:hypothetical protein Q9R20_06450 [Microbacterium sp. PRF11]|uniref:hypothetical protein n=1 Tax=Microbacterium sp. PRF11 TaxID=2962593 RepID=UPI002882A9D9|nr:hypothetical protein [Microbacterium sp. PRF11]MDT0116628.1 hypothetical protein [Microbacterium sp. PRF11]